MVTRVIARYLRVSPRKASNVTNLIKGMGVVKASLLLDVIEKRPTIYIKRLLNSAIDSADKKAHLLPADLYISLIKADKGPMLKRFRAASMGRATMIKHRTAHITLELSKIVRPEAKTEKAAAKKGTSDKGQVTRKAKAPVKKQKATTSKRR
ncbi:MAG: 50S ribosomal protein L22 [Candidatus Gorgyraea atricola]|nr:50S ribosomal protein L22 [Candidatus Gorgyraea atricola]